MASTKRPRAPASGNRLTEATAALGKGMILRGDAIQSVAGYFGVNSARISDLMDGVTFPDVKAAPPDLLPPPGPYLPACSVSEVAAALLAARVAIDRCATLLAGSSTQSPGAQ